jgi:single-stranded-DNA-specific exonuclease
MMSHVRWILPPSVERDVVTELSRQLGVSALIGELLLRRGFEDKEMASRFLDPKLKTLSDPFLLADMEAAVARILAAIDAEERIVLYGDYDVDGVTSLALMTRLLRAYGSEPARFLPHRMDEGYGLSPDGVARCVEQHRPQLLIALDCGTASVKEIRGLRESGVDVIVVDHHEPQAELPPCNALVNPKRGSDFHYLCTAGLVFKVAHALLKRRPLPSFDLRDVLDLVALGSVADIVPLVEENRVLVRHGLPRIADSRWIGVRALVEVSGVRAPISPGDVGFMLGPRLNAAGRLGTAQDALELLLTEDRQRACEIANELDAQNRERRAVEERVVLEAEKQIGAWFNPSAHAAIVVGAAGWHPGVIGIAASRVQKRYHRPTFVIGFDGEGIGKGSGRSVEGLSLVAALDRCGMHLEKFGGHAMAAGLTMREDRFPAFREAFLCAAREMLTDEWLRPRLRLDGELAPGNVTLQLLDELDSLEPFGIGNHAPVFFARGVTLAGEPRVMKEKHYSLILRHGQSESRAVWFGGAIEKLPHLPWDVAFTVERNEYQGLVRPQVQIKAVRSVA